MEPEAVLNPAVKKLASVNDFCPNLTIPVEPARRPRSATAVSAGANLQGSVRYNVERLQLAPASTERP